MRGKLRGNYNATVYACYIGYITQAIVNNLAPLLFLIFQDTFQLPLSRITLLVTMNFGIQLSIDLLGARFADRIGYRTCMVAGHVCAVIGLVGLGVFPRLFPNPYAGLLTAVFFNAVGGGIDEVLVSPIVEACPSKNKEAAMSLLHSFYCWGSVAVVVVSTLFLRFCGRENWSILCALWAIVPLVNVFLLTRVPILPLVDEGESMTIGGLAKSGLFWIFFAAMLCAGASEQGMSQWASAFAERGLGVSKTLGDLLGPCLFSVLMGTSRALYAAWAEKLDLRRCIVLSSALCIGAYLLSVFAPLPALSLVGCGICGFSVGILWPGLFSLASARMPAGGTAMFALLALAGDLGCGGGPTAVGFVAGAFSDNLKAGLLAAILFPACLIALCAALRKQKNEGRKT